VLLSFACASPAILPSSDISFIKEEAEEGGNAAGVTTKIIGGAQVPGTRAARGCRRLRRHCPGATPYFLSLPYVLSLDLVFSFSYFIFPI
jgi:hypothetical protein